MKITFATLDFKGFVSGVHSWMQRFSIELRKNGNECYFLIFTSGEGEFPFIKFLGENDFKWTEITLDKFPYTNERTRWIIEEVKKADSDIFLPGFSIAALYAIPWIKDAGITTINFIHSDDAICQAITERFVLNKDPKWNSHLTFCVSEYLYNKIGGQKVTNLYNYTLGVLPSIKKASFSNEPFRLVYIGRIEEEQKRILDTVKGVAFVIKNSKLPIEFYIYGTGSAEVAVKKVIADENLAEFIKYKGGIAANLVYEEITKYQCLILLSDYEGLPISLLEAMSCGLVPVCTNIKSGISQVVIPSETGYIVNNRNMDLLSVINELSSSAEIWERYSTNAIKLVDENFDIRNQTFKFLEIISNNRYEKKILKTKKILLPPAHPLLHFGREDVRERNISEKIIRRFKIIFARVNAKKSGLFNSLKRFISQIFRYCDRKKNLTECFSSIETCEIDETVELNKEATFNIIGNPKLLKICRGVSFRAGFHILMYPNSKLILNEDVFINNYCSINCLGYIEIGERTLIGEGVKLYDHNHKYEMIDSNLKVASNEFKIGSIKIGKNCWIGSNVTILKDVEIGDNVIIGAGCLIHKSVPNNSIVKANSSNVISNL